MDEEIAPERKAQGYTINLKKEQTSVGGDPMPLSHFAEFRPFEDGMVEIKRTITVEGKL